MFESWSSNPYEDYKISTDLTEVKNKLNNVFFNNIFIVFLYPFDVLYLSV